MFPCGYCLSSKCYDVMEFDFFPFFAILISPCGIGHIPPDLVVESFSHSLISSGREDLQIEEPVTCRHSPAFHFYPTLTGMLGAPLIRNQVIHTTWKVC